MIYERRSPARCFMTPPPPSSSSWKSRPSRSPTAMSFSDRKKSPGSVNNVNKGDLFHVIHKVPAGDSPYVKAKQVQLVDKDPGKAISLFWAAINAGDRVESALKDMALVMKQLNRSDEAIEAIKSFRHLCPSDSQESLDNILVELYKRSGRADEEIDMLRHKLKQIEDGVTFVGRTTKQARSQGKKIQITAEQEIARILGNLAWAYMQKGDYKTAEEHYRKALSFEVDRNKQCNLTICLMQMNKIKEAKFLLQAVSTATKNRKMDDSFAKSFERASKMLQDMESSSSLVGQYSTPNLETSSGKNLDIIKSKTDKWSSTSEVKASHKTEKWSSTSEVEVSHARRRLYETPDPARTEPKVPYIKPKRSSRGFSNGYQRETWRDIHFDPKPSFQNSNGNMQSNSVQYGPSSPRNAMRRPRTLDGTAATIKHEDTTVRGGSSSLQTLNTETAMQFTENDKSATKHEMVVDCANTLGTSAVIDHNQGNIKSLQKKSWADIVEEEEEFFNEYTNYDGQVFNDENENSNTVYGSVSSSRNPTVRRSLCFNPELTKERDSLSEEKQLTRRSRLQVFQDITPLPETPR